MSTDLPKDTVAKFVVSDAMGNEKKVDASVTTPTPSLLAEDDGDISSLNDDLRSVSGSNQLKSPSRISVDSNSIRRSFDSSFGGRMSNRGFGFDHARHSGSMNYSPIGNNSIYEIVMNTRRKNWLTYPSVADIPPITLTKNDLPVGWKEKIDSYRKAINSEYSVFKATNNIKSVNRMQQIRQLSDDKLNDKDDEGNEYEENNTEWCDQLRASGVPDFYLDEDFKLDNPRVFHKVLEGVELQLDNYSVSGTEDRIAGYTILRQKLNEYLDVVENLLIKEISRSSHKYYRTLAEVDQLEDTMKSCIETLDILSESLNKIDKQEVQSRLAKLKKICQRRNVEKLEQGLLQVKLVLGKVEECQKLYEQEKFEECLALTGSINSLIHGDNSDKTVLEWTERWPFKLVDLKSVPALSESREFITNIEIEIGGKYSLKLCDILLADMHQYCQKLEEGLTIDYLKNSTGDKSQFAFDDSFRESVTEVIRKLYRCEELTGAFDLYQEKTLAELKSILKKYLPHESSSNNDSSENGNDRTGSNAASGSKLAHLIKEQSVDEFVEMLERIFLHESIALRRLYGHQKMLLDISLTEMNSITEPNENQHNMITQLDIRPGINEIIHIIQLRTGKIIAVRREITSTLKFNYFLKFYDTCVSFIQECEALTGEFLTKYLSDVLASQVKNYISQFGPRNTRKLQSKIVNEKWTPAIVKPIIQKSVNEMVSSNDLDPLTWTKLSELFEAENEETGDQPPMSPTPDGAKTGSGHRKSVVVGDKTFVASESLLMTLTCLKELMILSLNLPSMYLPSLERQCYDFLRTFNTTAMNSVAPQGQIGKTTKNLSIMGESFDCLYEFVNIVQKFYQRLSHIFKDYRTFPDSYYNDLKTHYRTGSDKLYQAHAPPPPAP